MIPVDDGPSLFLAYADIIFSWGDIVAELCELVN